MATPTICRKCSQADSQAGPQEATSVPQEQPETLDIRGVPLYCPICGENEFFRTSAGAAKDVDFDLMSCICSGCGYVLHFRVVPEEGP